MIHIDWEAIEEVCANTKYLPDSVPVNIRQWDAFIKQYERAVDLVNGTWEPHYDWNDSVEFRVAINDQFYLGKHYKNSIYEFWQDIYKVEVRERDLRIFKSDDILAVFKNVNWDVIETAFRFTIWNININKVCVKLPLLPKKVGGHFKCSHNLLRSLEGCPEYVGGDFSCKDNKYLTSLEGCPKYVKGDFYCSMLPSLKGPGYVGGELYCKLVPGKNYVQI